MREFDWVMRGFYELPAKDVSRVLRALAGFPHVTLEDRDAVLAAIEAFDQRMVKRAKALGLAPRMAVP